MKKTTLLIAFLLCLAITSKVSAQTQLGTPTIKSAYGVSTTGITANWTALAALSGATGYDVKIYDASNSIVTTRNASGETTATLAITGLTLAKNTPYTYTVTAIGDGGVSYSNSAESAKSIPFYIQTDNQVVFQYAVADVATLFTDLKSATGAIGAADIYELTESGGAYTFVTATANNTILVKNTSVRAAAGLASKPIIKLNSTVASGTATNVFYCNTASMTIRFDGLDFDGVNPAVSGIQPILLYMTTVATGYKVYFSNCKIHDFLNVTGNGTIRLDGVQTSTGQVLDIQGSTINNCSGRIIYINDATTSITTINLKNNTFSNNVNVASRAAIIYNNSVNTGTLTVDHCTFYNIVCNGTDNIVRNSSGYGPMSFTNSIFSSVANTLPSTNTTKSYCYLAGFGTAPSGTNTIATAPSYSNTTTQAFALTNRGSLVGSDGLTAGNDTYYNLAIPAVGTGSGATSASFNANWSTVANASSYDVYLYQNGTQIGSVRNASGQATATLAITGLDASTAYTYRVMAKGDGTNYFNSAISAASAAVSTLAPSGITLATPTASSASAINTYGFTANWSNTDVNASGGYNVKVYSGVTLVNTYNASSPSATSLDITGLIYNTAYTYTVTAIGNGSTYTNSVASNVISVSTNDRTTLTAPTAGAATPASNGYTASWSADANASSFSIKTYIESNLVSTTTSSAGTTSIAVSGLLSGLDYTYTVTAVGDGITYITSSASSAQSFTTTGRVSSIVTDFSDVTAWGTPAGSVPANGSFFTGTINGFDLNAATLNANTTKGPKGESHTNRISLDKVAYLASVTLPAISSVGQLEIHFAMGTAGNSITLKEYSSATNSWSTVGTYAYDAANKAASIDQIVIVPFASAHTNAKFRIENPASGSCYLTQIIARATNPALLVTPTSGTASGIAATTFTANWIAGDANASNFEVKVYKGTTLKVTATTTSGSATTSLSISGLQADSTYTYKVKAIGDGDVSFSDSYQSVASTTFTMAHQLAVPVTGSVSNNTEGNFTANWTAVANATGGYNVKVYEDAVYLKTVSVSGQATESADVSGLVDYVSHMYSYSVTAIGDNSTYFNSNESAQTAQFGITTLINSGLSKPIITIKENSITVAENGVLSIYSLSGKEISKLKVTPSASIRLNSGLYIVSFINNDGIAVTKKISIR